MNKELKRLAFAALLRMVVPGCAGLLANIGTLSCKTHP